MRTESPTGTWTGSSLDLCHQPVTQLDNEVSFFKVLMLLLESQ